MQLLHNVKAAIEALIDIGRKPIEHVPVGGRDRVLIKDGWTVKNLDDRSAFKRHAVENVGDLIAYTKRYGASDGTTVFCGPSCIEAVLTDHSGYGGEDIEGDRVKLPLAHTESWDAWHRVIGRAMSLPQIRAFLDDRVDGNLDAEAAGFDDDAIKPMADSGEVPAKVAAALRGFSSRSTIEVDTDEGGDASSFSVKVVNQTGQNAGGKLIRLPRRFPIRLPVYQGWPEAVRVIVRLDVSLDDRMPRFTLTWIDLAEQVKGLRARMTESIRAELGDEWLVVAGQPKASARR